MTRTAAHQQGSVVIDIGGTKVFIAVVIGDNIVHVERIATDPHNGPQELVGRIGATASAVLRRFGIEAPRAAVVAMPGTLGATPGVVRSAANLPFSQFPLAAALSAEFGDAPITLEDDANCSIIGEVSEGAARGSSNAVYITISTGIGMGILIDGRLYAGDRHVAGEIGHMRVVPERHALPCNCGSNGCLEAYSSGRGIADRGAALLAESTSSALLRISGLSLGPVTTADVVRAAEERDPACSAVIDDAVRYIVFALNAVTRILDPERIILGGGLLRAELFRRRLDDAISADPDMNQRRQGFMLPAALGEHSALVGGLAILRGSDHVTGGAHRERRVS